MINDTLITPNPLQPNGFGGVESDSTKSVDFHTHDGINSPKLDTGPAGNDKEIQFNDGGVMGADSDFTWDKTTNKLTLGNATTDPKIRTLTSNTDLDIIIGQTAATTDTDAAGGHLSLYAGQGGTTVGKGGDVYIQAGFATASGTVGGDISLQSGQGGTNGKGGDTIIETGPGQGTGNGGNLFMTSGSGVSPAAPSLGGNGGRTDLIAESSGGTGSTGNGGELKILSGSGDLAGDLLLTAGEGWVTTLGKVKDTFADIVAAGTGYTVGDVLTLTGGGNNATLRVDAVTAGAVDEAHYTALGSGYSASTTYNVTGGTGTGFTVNVPTVTTGIGGNIILTAGDGTGVDGSIILVNSRVPASAAAAGTAGAIAWDANYIYICTSTNTWKRVGIATW